MERDRSGRSVPGSGRRCLRGQGRFCVGAHRRSGSIPNPVLRWRGLGVPRTRGAQKNAGSVARIADRNGNSLGFAYDGAGRLQTISDTLGREIVLRYNHLGFLDTITDFTGRSVRYDYYGDGERGGSQGDLKSVTYPRIAGTPTKNDFPEGATAVYTYSTGLSEALNHQLVEATNRSGQPVLAVSYYGESRGSSAGRVTQASNGGMPTTPFMLPTIRKPRPKSGDAALLAITNDGTGSVREYEFDSAHRCVLIREFTARADPGRATTLDDNRPRIPVRDSDPPYFESSFSYDDATGLVTDIRRADGGPTEQTFEASLRTGCPSRGAWAAPFGQADSGFCRRRPAGDRPALRVPQGLRMQLRAGVRHPGDRRAGECHGHRLRRTGKCRPGWSSGTARRRNFVTTNGAG